MRSKRYSAPGWLSRRWGGTLLIALVALAACPPEGRADPFTFGNLAVVSVATGGAAGNAQAVSILEYSPTVANQALPVQTIALPSTGTGTRLTMSNNDGLEGSLDLSANGRYLTLAGYNATAVTTANVAQTSTEGGSPVVRVIARIDIFTGTTPTPNLTTTTSSYSQVSIRSAATNDGTRFWTGGLGLSDPLPGTGLRTTTFGATGPATAVDGTVDARALHVFNGQLYGSTATTIFRTNVAQPTGSSAITTLVNAGLSNAVGFVLLDRSAAVTGVDTLYVADRTLGLVKYSTADGTNWSFESILSGGITGITGQVSGSSAELFVTTGNGATAGNLLQRFTDTAAFDAAFNPADTYATLATAGAGTVFRGVAIVPEPSSILLCGAVAFGFAGAAVRRYRRRALIA
jgi:hypothetical protein